VTQINNYYSLPTILIVFVSNARTENNSVSFETCLNRFSVKGAIEFFTL